MKILNEKVCTDDFGVEVYCVRGEYLWASHATAWRTYYPGTKGHYLEGLDYTEEDHRRSIQQFQENERNCNTCRSLVRHGFKRNSPASLMPGICGKTNEKILFHPDDWMGKGVGKAGRHHLKQWQRHDPGANSNQA